MTRSSQNKLLFCFAYCTFSLRPATSTPEKKGKGKGKGSPGGKGKGSPGGKGKGSPGGKGKGSPGGKGKGSPGKGKGNTIISYLPALTHSENLIALLLKMPTFHSPSVFFGMLHVQAARVKVKEAVKAKATDSNSFKTLK